MKINSINHLNNIKFKRSVQLKMSFDVDVDILDDGEIQLIEYIVERMDLSSIINCYSTQGRKPAVWAHSMLKILFLCYSNGIVSCRKIEEFSRYDLRAKYFLSDQKSPSYSTINRFRNLLEDHTRNLLQQFVDILIEMGHVDLSSIYIDGTKIESYANRYTFVWRKNIERFQEKLKLKIAEYFNFSADTNLEYLTKLVHETYAKNKGYCKENNVVFVCGSGRRKLQIQKEQELLEEWIEKLDHYKRALEIMGERNSYSKTDHDATFMRMKDDHMMNGQLKPAYNIQMASSGNFIVGVSGYQLPSDMNTLRPFINQIDDLHPGQLHEIVADAGYESIENYKYLDEEDLVAYIKPLDYEQKKRHKYKQDISRFENMRYHEDIDAFECSQGKLLKRQKDTYRTHKKSGYREILHIYACFECKDCPVNKECVKWSKKDNPEEKRITFSPEFQAYREESEANCKSLEGINHRINRSIQAEGAFSYLKDGLQYDRFRHKGMKKIVSDLELMSIGINLNTLLSKLKNGKTGLTYYKKAEKELA